MIGVNRRRVMGGGASDEIIMTSASNPEVLAVCYAQGWAAHADYMTKTEAEAVTSIGIAFRRANITTFHELEYFTSITSIDDYAFLQTPIQEITLPNTIQSIGTQSFRQSSIKHITFPTSVTTIKQASFRDTAQLIDATFLCQLTTTESSIFQASGIQSVILPSTFVDLPDYIFFGASSLASIDLPATLASIGNYAFNGCTGLTSLTCRATTPPTIGTSVFNNVTAQIYVPSESVSTYQSASGWSAMASRIQAIP